ncbi:NACHT domain-containing protein [Calothrix sp. PCC 6303]|uniref:NACHT domain-containing protein n=1 Tax=Calothrix sp. PCC 6303 TaxID=1170562 RepID=UPI0002A02B2F|nr:NACHT domain-containing NTPase [Calothrix sp. PCC 6303]AFZ04415.1 transcriptional regulator, XRE family [Calothrix sp. PCC 6303]
MAKRSLQASSEGIRKAKQAFKRKGWTQEYLATEVGLETRQPIWKFFTGKAVDRQVFHEICLTLGISADDIIEKPEATKDSISTSSSGEMFFGSDVQKTLTTDNIDSLVTELRSTLFGQIQNHCATLRLLDIAHPLSLEDLYVDVNIQEGVSSRSWLEINSLESLKSNNETQNFKQFKPKSEGLAGLEAISKYPKIMVLGKPGAGKTTFLQSVAISCNRGQIKPDLLPIFVSLKSFVEEVKKDNQIDLLTYINSLYILTDLEQKKILHILLNGRCLLILDALDEASEDFIDLIISKICHFTDRFYLNHVIISCRSAAQHYQFRSFTEVEIADFNIDQIAAFTYKWFITVGKTSFLEGKALAQQFMQKLQLPENQKIRELASTPLLLNITCLVFHTLGDFPVIRSELYRQGLELLLARWDEARGIKRDTIYRELSLLHKIKLLSKIAASSFTEGDYFFSGIKLQQIISDYISQLPQFQKDVDALLLESGAILKAIESQHGLLVERAHGVYSFSNLTFYEYFTAKEIVANASLESLKELTKHLFEKRWQEVFLLVASMLPSADIFLQIIKAEIDKLVLYNQKIYNFLVWVEQKSSFVKTSHHPSAIRSFYFNLALPTQHQLARDQNLALSLDKEIAGELDINLSLDMALTHAISVSANINSNIFSQRISAVYLSLKIDDLLLLANKPSLRQRIGDLKDQLPPVNQAKNVLKAWWEENGVTWTTKLRSTIIEECKIGNNWQFSQTDSKLLQQYWEGNKLLLECLRSATNVSKDLRRSLEESLFVFDGGCFAQTGEQL